ncbi:MAG: shikimate kinase [Clostridia bacterium]|nr:shikimate kinase [Clostridia bacterium]
MNNIVLIGFMGTGKTTIGKGLAHKLSYDFLDTDEEIERQEGISISNIFDKYGEEYFRLLEQKTVKQASSLKNTVISTGGGVVLNPQNINYLKSSGLLVCLEANIDTIYKNALKSDNRPLLCGHQDLKGRITAMLKNRKGLYDCADIKVNVDEKYIHDIIEEIIITIKERKIL